MGFVAHIAQQPNGFGRGVLLAGKSGYKPTTTDFAARLEAAEAHEKLAPGRQPVGFTSQQPPEDNTPTTQQRPCNLLDRFVVLDALVEARCPRGGLAVSRRVACEVRRRRYGFRRGTGDGAAAGPNISQLT